MARTRLENGVERRGFLVHVAGGMGGAPMLSHVYTEFLPVEEMYNFASAILRVFDRYGERKSRMKARMKFLVQSMGWERFREALDLERERVGPIPFPADDLHPPFAPPATDAPEPASSNASSPVYERWHRDSVIAHQRPGFRGVHVRLRLGDIVSDRLRGLADVARRYSSGEARVSIEQNLYLPWVREADLPDLHAALVGIELGGCRRGNDRGRDDVPGRGYLPARHRVGQGPRLGPSPLPSSPAASFAPLYRARPLAADQDFRMPQRVRATWRRRRRVSAAPR